MENKIVSILIVEDEPAHAAAICRALEESDKKFETRVASSLHEFREVIAKQIPDIVLTDLNLTDGKAFEILSNPPENLPYPVLVMTAYGNEETVTQVLKSGALDYIVKSSQNFLEIPHIISRSLREWSNIIERKYAEEALKESEERFRSIFENNSAAIAIIEPDTTISMVNDAYCKISGYTKHGVVGMRWTQQIPPEDLERLKEYNRRRLINPQDAPDEYEFTFYHKNGEIRHALMSVTLLQKSRKIIASFIDITERKQIEDKLRESEYFFKESQRAAFIGSYKTDFSTGFWESSEVLDEIFGIDRNYIRSVQGWLGIIHPDDREMMDKYLKEEVISKRQPFNKEYRIIRKSDGKIRWVQGLGKVDFDIKGNILSMIGTLHDITERKHTVQTLQKSEEKYRTLIEQTTDGVFIIDSKGDYIDVNSGACKMLGYSRDEILSMNMKQLVHEEDLAKQTDDFNRVLEGENVIIERRLLAKDGTYLNTELNTKMLPDGRFCAFARDITERKKAEAERLRLQNLESLGVLAGGIAHDFNNILAVILGRTSLVLDDIREGSARNDLIAIEKASKRAVGLTHQLLTFAKGGAPEKCNIDISKIIKDTTNFSLSGSNIIAELSFNDTLNIEADPGQVAQVIQNLVINAKQAMPSGGKIRISTENYDDINEAKFVKITIEDQGIGIPKEQLDKIFDPYFTTKQAGNGLGLSVCHSIIKRHDGRIYVQSEIAKGTTFTIMLPATKKGIFVETGIKREISRKLKILIMDDEEYIKELLSTLLLRSGHTVSVSSNGEEALRIYKDTMDQGNIFDLVFMDLTIKGGMGGKEAIKKLREMDPDAKVIASSGYADSTIASFIEDGFDGMLNKPYTKNELNEVIFDVMNK